MEELEKIDNMFSTIYNKAKYDIFGYNYSDYVNDTIVIWNYIRQRLGKQQIARFIEV